MGLAKLEVHIMRLAMSCSSTEKFFCDASVVYTWQQLTVTGFL
jgi:hypothetical protein